MQQSQPELAYYVINNVLTQLVLYLVPAIAIIVTIIWAAFYLGKRSNRLVASNKEMIGLLVEIKHALQNGKR
jgi:flagellar biogenesis protein FliO